MRSDGDVVDINDVFDSLVNAEESVVESGNNYGTNNYYVCTMHVI